MIDSLLNHNRELYGTLLASTGLQWAQAYKPIDIEYRYLLERIGLDNHNNLLRHSFIDNNPLLFIPPEAGHSSNIVDYGPDQSLIECANIHYYGSVYSIEKLPALCNDNEYGIQDCIETIKKATDILGPVHLVGLCQGGWQAVMFAAKYPEMVRTLTLAASPIDFHAKCEEYFTSYTFENGETKNIGIISAIALNTPMSFYRNMVNMSYGNMPGSFITGGFVSMHPYERFVGDYVELIKNYDSQEYIARSQRFTSWYYYQTQAVPGRMYLEAVEWLFKGNRLVKGEIEGIDLSRITQPLYLVAGFTDDITPYEQLFNIEHYVNSDVIDKKIVTAGHIGVFMGKKIIREYWASQFERLNNLK